MATQIPVHSPMTWKSRSGGTKTVSPATALPNARLNAAVLFFAASTTPGTVSRITRRSHDHATYQHVHGDSMRATTCHEHRVCSNWDATTLLCVVLLIMNYVGIVLADSMQSAARP